MNITRKNNVENTGKVPKSKLNAIWWYWCGIKIATTADIDNNAINKIIDKYKIEHIVTHLYFKKIIAEFFKLL